MPGLPLKPGKGASRRFKAELAEEYAHLLPAWYAFRDARAHRRAVEWLADNSLGPMALPFISLVRWL